jgi:hypothetical protein
MSCEFYDFQTKLVLLCRHFFSKPHPDPAPKGRGVKKSNQKIQVCIETQQFFQISMAKKRLLV